MSPKCTAPKAGHVGGGAANCPVHGTSSGRKPALPAPGAPAPMPQRDLPAWQAVAGGPETSPALFAELATDKRVTLRRGIAWRRNVPPEVLAFMASDDDRAVRQAVASNTAAPPEALARLASDTSQHVRANVAENRSASSETLLALAQPGEGVFVQARVASNPATPPEAFDILVKSGRWDVLQNAAKNPSVPPDVLTELARSDDRRVLMPVTDHTSTPSPTLVALTSSPHVQVKLAAMDAAVERICENLGVAESNRPAVDSLWEQAWWEMDADSPAVAVALALAPND